MTRKKALPKQPSLNSSEPTQQQREFLEAHEAAKAASQPMPRLNIEADGGNVHISADQYSLALLDKTFATTSETFTNTVLMQLCSALMLPYERENPEAAINRGLTFVAAINPRDELETMLAVQMAAIHSATMTFARRLNHVDNISQQDSAERTLNKLARTFTTQMDALKRYRTGGEQKVIVQHVNVNDGGQAIVGTVEQSVSRGEG